MPIPGLGVVCPPFDRYWYIMPALDGRANDALVEFLARRLALPRRAVVLAHGGRSRHKVVHIAGLTSDEVRQRLRS